jgi:hypothetical protein
MTKLEKNLIKILSGTSDKNIRFQELRNVLDRLGFSERVKGSHHIFWHKDILEIINLQTNGFKAKAYQVKQVRNIILKYKLGEISNE